MSRSFLRQATQVSASVDFSDTLAAGLSLKSSSYTLEDDLNSIRSQLRRFLYSTGSGNWFDDIPLSPDGQRRGFAQLASDLGDMENKKFSFRTQKNTVGLVVPTGQNYVTLSVGAGFAPSYVAAVTAQATGTIVTQLSGNDFNLHSLRLTSGSNVLVPKNLVVVVSASSGNPLQASSGEDIYALLQVSSSVTDGDTFDDSTKRIQLSFVQANSTRTGITSASVADVQGKYIQYSYARRIPLDQIPDDAYLDNVFVDMVADLSAAVAAVQASTNLNSAIDNQVGAATQTDRHIEVRITSPFSWSFTNAAGSRQFLTVDANGDTVRFDVDNFDVRNVNTAQYLNSLRTNVSGNWVQLSAGTVSASGSLTVSSATGSNLVLSGGGNLVMLDGYKVFSTYTGEFKLADSVADWNQYVTNFGQVTLFDALHALSQSVTGAKGQRRRDAVVTANSITADTNVTYPTNLDAPLLDFSAYPSASFVSGVLIYLNGQLQRNGENGSSNHDVYPGTTPANGDLKFEFKLNRDDVITMVIVN